MENAAAEAAQVVRDGFGTYFRYFGKSRPNAQEGDKVFYTENGLITGFCIIKRFERKYFQKCETTGRNWPNGWYAYMDATTWQWIQPLQYKGFQGWRYFPHQLFKVQVIGDYTMKKPQRVMMEL